MDFISNQLTGKFASDMGVRNDEGQLSFLRFAVSASPEVFTFAHSRRQQAPLEGPHGSLLTCGSANQAWLSVDLVEVLCHLAEIGQGSTVHTFA